MIPHTSWRTRLRLVVAILRGSVYVDYVENPGWGQSIRLRTAENVRVIGSWR